MPAATVADATQTVQGGMTLTPAHKQKWKNKPEYCFAREKENVFAQQKQSVPMSINDCVEMTMFLCLICFSIYTKMQGFIEECFLAF